MIHYFNPGHELAVLCASKYFQPKTNVALMQQQLSYLPLWYASPNDFVLIEILDPSFLDRIKNICLARQIVSLCHFAKKDNRLFHQTTDFWGISPQIIHYFEQLSNHYALQLKIPCWTEKLQTLCSRLTAHTVLANLIDTIPDISPDILPHFFMDMETIKQYVWQSKEKLVLKSPYSSSGRGLIWFSPGEITIAKQQIIGGMLKKQQRVSIEKVLDKQLDFSMQFRTTPSNPVEFIGYSIFYTDQKGSYKSSLLACQEMIEQQITAFIHKNLLYIVKNALAKAIQEKYSPNYIGNIGVDMLVYKQKNIFHLHPCVEINMRKSMGYLAICLQTNYVSPKRQGILGVDYHHLRGEIVQIDHEWKKQFPLRIKNGKIISGYLSLSPIREDSCYHAYLKMKY